jgi:hypothetical protein
MSGRWKSACTLTDHPAHDAFPDWWAQHNEFVCRYAHSHSAHDKAAAGEHGYGLFTLLAMLLLVFVVNEKNWRPLKNKSNGKLIRITASRRKFAIERSGNLWTSYVSVTMEYFFKLT